MENFEILVGREHIDPKLLMGGDLSIARIMGSLNLCVCFAGMLDGRNIAACLLGEHEGHACEVDELVVDESYAESGLDRELLTYVMDYARSKGFNSMEIGAGNAFLEKHQLLLKTGFRVTGVVLDYYQSEGKSMVVRNSIVNRDMIRYRVDFQDGWDTWTEEVKLK